MYCESGVAADELRSQDETLEELQTAVALSARRKHFYTAATMTPRARRGNFATHESIKVRPANESSSNASSHSQRPKRVYRGVRGGKEAAAELP